MFKVRLRRCVVFLIIVVICAVILLLNRRYNFGNNEIHPRFTSVIPKPLPNRDGSETAEIARLRHLISGLALNNTIIIASANTGFIRLALNFHCSMRKLGITNVLFWALDEAAANVLDANNIPNYFNPMFFSSKGGERYHSDKFLKMMAERPKFWKWVIRTGYNMMFLDVDIAIISNPLDALVGDADIETQIDEKPFWRAVDQYYLPEMCGGAFFLKSNNRVRRFLDRVEEVFIERDKYVIDDQEALNFVIRDHEYTRIVNRFQRQRDEDVPLGGHSRGPNDERVSVRFVPIDRFLNGHIWGCCVDYYSDGTMEFVVKYEFIQQIKPALVHMNGDPSKEESFKEFLWWHLNDNLSCPFSEWE
jgi:Nucleotide-diphospho-sugar transferase